MAKKKAKKAEYGSEDGEFIKEAIERYDRAYEREETNIREAYEDLEFQSGKQWPDAVKQERVAEFRPVLTINRIPQFVRQVTGDIRMMRPSIRVVPVDSRGDPKTADVVAGMIRYIENRSDAQAAYTSGADSQVACGIGHWRVLTEYAEDTTFNQEIRVLGVPDGVSVLWDPDAVLPNKEDAQFCFVPVDMTKAAYEKQYPDAPVTDFGRTTDAAIEAWYGDDFVRVAEYWEKRPEKRLLALLPDGSIDDLTGEDEIKIAEMQANPEIRVEERDGFCVYRSLITCGHVLEEAVKWPGRYIPIVPVVGEEYRIGRKTIRHGIVRFAKDPQRMYNYFRSTQTEVVALQPKSPFIGTRKNFEDNPQWDDANRKNYPYLTYEPDGANGSVAPQRSSPAVNVAGLENGMLISADEMKAVVGIYDAGLGARSNETSGKAINARQRESDIGTFVYIDNFSRAIRHTGRVIIDLIPHIYDVERIIRVVGEDGKVDLVSINKPVMMEGIEQTINDVTLGAYDVVLETGPSYSTRREESREGMAQFLQAAPTVAPLVLDLVAEAQDWPNKDKWAKRLKFALPPQIQEAEAAEAGEAPPPGAQQQPDPMAIAELEQTTTETEGKKLDNAKKMQELVNPPQEGQPGQKPNGAQQQQPQGGSTVTDQELAQFAQQVFGAIEQLQQQMDQMAQLMQPPAPIEQPFDPANPFQPPQI